MRILAILLLLVLFISHNQAVPNGLFNRLPLANQMYDLSLLLDIGPSFSDIISKLHGHLWNYLIESALEFSHGVVEYAHRHYEPSTADYDYFTFFPVYSGSVVPHGPSIDIGPQHCFKSNVISSIINKDGTISLTVSMNGIINMTDTHCRDVYVFATLSGFMVVDTGEKGDNTTHEVLWTSPKNMTVDERWDELKNGIRVLHFSQRSWLGVLDSVRKTLELFEPMMIGPGVSDRAAKLNAKFMWDFVGKNFSVRAVQDVPLDASGIHSGDVFGINRLDGVDPMLAWGMGSSTGHVTVAIRDDKRELYVAESTTKDVYWPNNGIQVTKYDTWIKQCKKASMAVVHMPLSPEYASMFDEKAAWQFFKSVEGVDYGFSAILLSWLDTVQDNYPCWPPNYDRCLSWEVLEIVSGLVDHYKPAVTQLMWNQAMNNRLRTHGLNTAQVYRTAASRGIKNIDLTTMVELDTYLYDMKHNNGSMVKAPAMVCSVFVCRMWKAAGLFGNLTDTINCGEHTNLDVYSLAMFDKPSNRPAACKRNDPDNDVCQIMGQYTLFLNDYNSIAPYRHMHERCPSRPPEYHRPDGC